MIRLEIALSKQRRAELHVPEQLTEEELERLHALIDLVRAAVLIEPKGTPPTEEANP